MENKSAPLVFALALALAVGLLIPYELYWRYAKDWPPGYDLESDDVWADQRSGVDDLSEKDVVILGSSRAHFDLNIHVWDSITGRRPLQLAYPGTSPYIPFEDIVNNSDFKGLLVVGVAPGLFYTIRDSWAAGQGKRFVDHYHNRTYAQAFSQQIYDFIDPHFGYLQNDLTLERLVDRLPFSNRDSVNDPTIWPPMVAMDEYRNIRMIPVMETDSAAQQAMKDIWFNPDPKNRFTDSINNIMHHYVSLAKKLKSRGGNVAFIRAPISGYYLETEPRLFPREEYWDRLIDECDCYGYHYADHPVTSTMDPPEWSHLTRRDSDLFTKILIDLLKQDQLL